MNQTFRLHLTDGGIAQRAMTGCYAAIWKWHDLRTAVIEERKTESVLHSLDARTLYDVGATDMIIRQP